MHFAKTYAQLLTTLPPEIKNKTFEYRKLKQLINQTASELDCLGLGPSVLRSMHTLRNPGDDIACVEHDDNSPHIVGSENSLDASSQHTIVYEISLNSSLLEPELRLSLRRPSDTQSVPMTPPPIYHVDLVVPEQLLSRVTRALSSHPLTMRKDGIGLSNGSMKPEHILDLIIPLPSDVAFFQLLTSTITAVSSHLDILHDDFNSALPILGASISFTARPASSVAPHSFSAYSFGANNATSFRPGLPEGESDLYAWREIFRLYTEMEVFESVSEMTRGEKSIEEAERQLKSFEELVRWRRGSLVFPGSKEALDGFLDLNLFILEVKKFQHANAEAARKILKKHAKRTTFPIPSYLLEKSLPASGSQATLITRPSSSLARLLVQAIGEILLPVVPQINEYSCPICTSIAFRPIRLRCGHFFCVRCLAKLQKRSMPNCPICRAPTVLKADSSNVDYGLLNFMADWFPLESREKLRLNEHEVIQEQLEEFGLADVRVCQIM